MKTTCDFCKTEYSVDRQTRGTVRCALCGHTWTVAAPSRANAWLVVISAVCALLAAGIFALAVITRSRIDAANAVALYPAVTDIRTVTGDDGAARFVVSGTITNNTDEIYGVPDLMVIFRDGDNREIARQKFMPTATLIDARGVVNFSHELNPVPGVRRIAVELVGIK